MTLDEILAELAKQDQPAVVKAIQTNHQPLFQSIFDMGHGEATRKLQPKVTEAEGQITKMKDDLVKAQESIKTLSATNPDVAKLQQVIVTLEGKLKAAEEEGTDRVHAERRETFVSQLQSELVAKGVDPDYAGVLLAKPEVIKRIRINKAGEREVLRKGSDVVLMPGDKPLTKAVAEDLLADIPPKFITSGVDNGSEVEAGGGGEQKPVFFTGLRAKLETKRKEDAKRTAGPGEVERRLGMGPATD